MDANTTADQNGFVREYTFYMKARYSVSSSLEGGGGCHRRDPDVGENPASLSAWDEFGSRGRRAAFDLAPLFPHNPVSPDSPPPRSPEASLSFNCNADKRDTAEPLH